MQNTNEIEKIEQDKRLKQNMLRIKHKLVVMSGKGGVGKTTVAVNIAASLAAQGNTVGILDVDIHGPNIAKMLGVEQRRMTKSALGIEPIEVFRGLKAVSLAFIMEDKDQPIIWRGPLKMITIKQFLADVNWGDLDYLIVDSSPGTGDEPLSVCQLMGDVSGAVIVTTPQDVAILDARKSVLFAKELKIPFIGIIENMSGFTCPHCAKEIKLFGEGGGKKAAVDLNISFLGKIPLQPEIVSQGDLGTPFITSDGGAPAVQSMKGIIEKIVEEIKK
ncbi:MAG: Mrp/NBP35 family ATP-binding protein [Candidatus Omnitrophica bacterium]|nr:Mrp/NBP35 family ATP-binding protein [Candidatus Omnitrophota bacterium]